MCTKYPHAAIFLGTLIAILHVTLIVILHLHKNKNQLSTSNRIYQSHFYNRSNGFLFRTGGLTNEGYGSYFQRMKSSIVTSMFLNKTLVIKDVFESEHHYNVALQVNEVYKPVRLHNGSSCELSIQDEGKMLDLMCGYMSNIEGDYSALAGFRKDNNCTEITHTKHRPYEETYEGLNDCIQPWMSNTFNNIFRVKNYTLPWKVGRKCINVAIHVRWGDLAGDDVMHLNERSMQTVDINSVVYNLRKTKRCINYYIFVKNPNEKRLSQFLFDHTVVNSTDDLYDMFLYSHMDICVQGSSSFSAVSSLINQNKIIITDSPYNPKYTFKYKAIGTVYGIDNLTYVDGIRNYSRTR